MGDREFQIFDLYVLKDWSPAEAVTLKVSVARVYLIKHRMMAALKKETRKLEKLAEQALRRH